MKDNIEFRESIEVRAVDEAGKMIIEGIVNNVGEFSKTLGGVFREKILPGVFERAISKANEENRDIFLLHQHDATSLPLASVISGTLEITEDTKTNQLTLRAELPETTFAKDIYELVKSNVLRDFSFGFSKPVSTWKMGTDNIRERTISSIDLREISIVKTGAYNGTEVFARALEEIEELREDEENMKDNENIEVSQVEDSEEKRAYIYDDNDLMSVSLQVINYVSSIIRKNKKAATSFLDDTDLEALNNSITTCTNIINKINASDEDVTSVRSDSEDKDTTEEPQEVETRSIELELKRKRIKL